jgi:sugar lactone lactonase YvrE
MTPPVVFAFADPERRTWLSLNRAGDAFHVVTPTPDDAQLITDGLRRQGQLSCTCAGGRYRGTCYVTKACEAIENEARRETAKAEDRAFLAAVEADIPGWFDGPPGELAEVFGR